MRFRKWIKSFFRGGYYCDIDFDKSGSFVNLVMRIDEDDRVLLTDARNYDDDWKCSICGATKYEHCDSGLHG